MTEENQNTLKRERLPFTQLEDSILDDERISRQALLVYWVLCRHANSQTQQCWPGLNRIVKMTRCGKASVIEAIKHLEEYGYIRKETRVNEKHPGEREPNLYTILTQYTYERVQSGLTQDRGSSVQNHGSSVENPNHIKELDPMNKKEEETPSSPPLPEKTGGPKTTPPAKDHPGMYGKLIAVRKCWFKTLGDLPREFQKHVTEIDGFSDEERVDLLAAYEAYLTCGEKWPEERGYPFASFWKELDRYLQPFVEKRKERARAEAMDRRSQAVFKGLEEVEQKIEDEYKTIAEEKVVYEAMPPDEQLRQREEKRDEANRSRPKFKKPLTLDDPIMPWESRWFIQRAEEQAKVPREVAV